MNDFSKEEIELIEKYRTARTSIQYAICTLLKTSNVEELERKTLEEKLNKYI